MSTWIGAVPEKDDFGDPIVDTFIDGKTRFGPWAIMTPKSWERARLGVCKLGTGIGQRYQKQSDGSWLKVEG